MCVVEFSGIVGRNRVGPPADPLSVPPSQPPALASHYQATYVNIVTHNCSSQLAAGEEETKFSAPLVAAPTSTVYTGLLVVPTR